MAETPPQPFRDVLSAALEASGTGQEELARRIGRSGAAVSQWRKFKEALIDAPLDDTERGLIRQTVQRFVAYHVTRGSEQA